MIKIADISMDNVNIEIQSSSSKATDGVNQLIETLNNLNSALSASQQNINKYTQSMNRISKASKSVKIPSVSNNINKVNKTNNANLSKELELLNSNLPNGGKKIVNTKDIEQATSGVSSLKARLDSLKGSTDKISQRIKNMFKSIIGSKAAQLAIKGIGSAFGNLGGRLANIKQSIGSTLKSFSKYVLALYGIRSAFYGVRNVTREFLSSQNAVAQQLSANISYLKYALGSTLAPVIQFITNLIYSLLKAIQYLVYYFAKINIFSNASAKNLASGAGSAGKTTKELQKQLQAFDELNNISLENNSGSGGGGGAGSITPDIDLSQIDPAFKDLFDDIDNWGWKLADKINNALSKIDWEPLLEGAETAATRLARILNDFTERLDFKLLGYSLAQGFNVAITYIDTLFQTYEWGNLGKKLGEGLFSIVDTIRWETLGRLLTDGIKAAIETAEGLVVEFANKGGFVKLGESLSTMLMSAFGNIPWDKAANAINVGVTGILDTIIEFLDKTPWDEIGRKIGEFLNKINWSEILGKAFEAAGKLGGAIVETLWNTIFSGSDTVILAILGLSFATVKSGILKDLLPGLATIAPGAKKLLAEIFGNMFRITVGILLIFDAVRTSWDKATNDANNGLSLENIAKNLGGGLEAGVGALMLTKNVKIALLVGIAKISFDTGLDIGAEINKSDWVQKEYDHYIEVFGIDKEENPFMRVVKGIMGALGTLGDFILIPIRKLGETIGTAIGNWWLENIQPWFTAEKWQELADGAIGEFINKFNEWIKPFKPIGEWWINNVAPWFTKEKWQEIADKAKQGIENKFNEWKEKFKPIKDWWDDKVAPWFTKERWQEVTDKAKQGIESKFNEWKEKFKPIQDWWNDKVAPWFTKEKWQEIANKAKQGIENKFNEWKNNFHPIKDWWDTKIAPWFTWEKWKELGQKAVNGIQSAFSGLNIKIKLPHFSWTSQPASGWMANVLSALNLPTSLPKLNVSWYAEGGFPTEGDLFFANEAGAEMVGSIGNRTAVANNDQITRAIAQATYQAISQALNENQDNDQPIIINIGNETLYKGMTKSRSQASNQYGIAL